MSILLNIITALTSTNIPIETSVFSGKAPDEYIILTPLNDNYPNYADNKPIQEIQSARLSLFSKSNYIALKNSISKLLLDADFTITDRLYVEFESDTKYHHYVIDIEKIYQLEE